MRGTAPEPAPDEAGWLRLLMDWWPLPDWPPKPTALVEPSPEWWSIQSQPLQALPSIVPGCQGPGSSPPRVHSLPPRSPWLSRRRSAALPKNAPRWPALPPPERAAIRAEAAIATSASLAQHQPGPTRRPAYDELTGGCKGDAACSDEAQEGPNYHRKGSAATSVAQHPGAPIDPCQDFL